MIDFNMFYRKTIFETFELEEERRYYTFEEFGKTCESMQLPFFVLEEITELSKLRIRKKYKTYPNYTEFYRTIADNSIKMYDGIRGIKEGCFTVKASSESYDYTLHFLVCDFAVLVKVEKKQKNLSE